MNTKEENYHLSRDMFILVGEALYTINNISLGHLEWATQELKLTEDVFYSCPRGNILGRQIQVYKGANFDSLSIEEYDDIRYKIKMYLKLNGNHERYLISNGVIQGDIGDRWTNKTSEILSLNIHH